MCLKQIKIVKVVEKQNVASFISLIYYSLTLSDMN